MSRLKKILDLFKKTYDEWQDDNVSRLAAALAYYTIFSLAPLLIIAVTVAGFVWSRNEVESQVLYQVQGLLGENGAEFVQSLMQNASVNLDSGIFTTVIGVGALIFGSIGVFRELHNALNTMWGIEEKKVNRFWNSLKSVFLENFLSFAMVMGVGFVLLVSLIISTGLTALNRILTDYLLLSGFLMGVINTVVTLAVVTLVFALLFKYLPDTQVAWKDVFLGGFVTAILFSIGKYAIGIYLGNSSVGVTFGAAGSLALLLIWVYYSAQIFFFGAEFTQVYANQYGSKIRTTVLDEKTPGKTSTAIALRNKTPLLVEGSLLSNSVIAEDENLISGKGFPISPLSKRVNDYSDSQPGTYKKVLTFLGIMGASLISTILIKINVLPKIESKKGVENCFENEKGLL